MPDELWAKFRGQSPQQMKLAISTVLCIQFQLTPEHHNKRKPSKQIGIKSQLRDGSGRFTGKTLLKVPSPELETPTSATDTKTFPVITTLAPQNPPGITVLEPQNPQTMPTNVSLVPQIPPENTVEQPDNRQKVTSDMAAGKDKVVALHPSYNIGFSNQSRTKI